MTQAGAPSNGCTSQVKNGWLVSRETMVHRTCSSSTITITGSARRRCCFERSRLPLRKRPVTSDCAARRVPCIYANRGLVWVPALRLQAPLSSHLVPAPIRAMDLLSWSRRAAP